MAKKIPLRCACGAELHKEYLYECEDCEEMNSIFDQYSQSFRDCANDHKKTNDEEEHGEEQVIEGDCVEITLALPKVWIE